MNQWANETLVAIEPLAHGSYKVLELPVRDTTVHTSRRSFKRYEQAERYIETQYGDRALTVQPEDISEELERRKAVA